MCPYCEVQLGPRAVDMRSADLLQGVIPRAYSTSIIILSLNVVIYLLTVALAVHFSQGPVGQALGNVWSGFPGQLLVLVGAKYAPEIYQYGQWWRLLTAGFLHGSLIHIAMNMWVMFDLVAEVEQFYGSTRLIILYFVSTVAGFFLSLLWSPGSVSVGASAPCFGLIGAMMAIGLRRDNPMAQAIRYYYRRWAIYAIIFSFLPFMRIDIAAHLGGLAGGFIVGYLAGLPELPGSPRERALRILAVLAVVLTAYCFLQDFRFFQAMQRSLNG